MIYLPDVNIWIALTSDRHVHHQIAKEWLKTIGSGHVAFCRLSELGFLRLLTNAQVMRSDVLSPAKAWQVYDQWRADGRVIFLTEQATFSEQWRHLGNQISGGPNAWTDAYLAAFATDSNATVITLDRTFRSLGKANVTPLI